MTMDEILCAAPLSVECAFGSVEHTFRSSPEKIPSQNTALSEEIEQICRAMNFIVTPPHLYHIRAAVTGRDQDHLCL